VSLPEGKASGNRKVFLPAIRVTTVMKTNQANTDRSQPPDCTRFPGAHSVVHRHESIHFRVVGIEVAASALRAWETNWPARNKRPVVKVVFDRAAGEVRILGRWKGEPFSKTLLVERDLAATLEEAKSFIKQRTPVKASYHGSPGSELQRSAAQSIPVMSSRSGRSLLEYPGRG
jgi:hypothetical protein